MDTSVRPPRVPTRSFPLMTVPYTAGAPCSYWTLTCLAVSSALHSLMGFLFVSPVVCLQLPSDSISRWTPLLFGYPLPTAGRGRDFHPLERAPAGRTNEIKHAARVLSRNRDARRTRILRIRLRLTVRVKKGGPITPGSRAVMWTVFLDCFLHRSLPEEKTDNKISGFRPFPAVPESCPPIRAT